jgi:hypothetical protein
MDQAELKKQKQSEDGDAAPEAAASAAAAAAVAAVVDQVVAAASADSAAASADSGGGCGGGCGGGTVGGGSAFHDGVDETLLQLEALTLAKNQALAARSGDEHVKLGKSGWRERYYKTKLREVGMACGCFYIECCESLLSLKFR